MLCSAGRNQNLGSTRVCPKKEQLSFLVPKDLVLFQVNVKLMPGDPSPSRGPAAQLLYPSTGSQILSFRKLISK